MASAWGKSWGTAFGKAWGSVQVIPQPPVEKDPYRAIAAAVFNRRTDGPNNAIYTRIARRRGSR